MPQPPNLQKMLADAQAMLAAQQEAQEALKSERVEASAGGGMVKVAMTGDLRLDSLVIAPDGWVSAGPPVQSTTLDPDTGLASQTLAPHSRDGRQLARFEVAP